MDVADSVGRAFLCTDGSTNNGGRAGSVNSSLTENASQRGAGVSTPAKPSSQEKDNIQRRLKSFLKWVGEVLPIQLAIAGFVYIGPGDKVQCETCKVKLYNWTKDMVPLETHRETSPDCSFLKKWFPLKASNDRASTPSNGFSTARAKYQDRVHLESRLSTFVAWPLKLDIHSPQKMSLAGFFFIGSADRARCFYCGLTLRDWDTDDDPFEAHQKYSPKCDYINHILKERIQRKAQQTPSLPEVEKAKFIPAPLLNSQGPQVHATESDGYKASETVDYDAGASPSGTSNVSKWKHSTQFEAVMAMGFRPELIQRVIDERMRTTGAEYPDVTSLFIAVEESAS